MLCVHWGTTSAPTRRRMVVVMTTMMTATTRAQLALVQAPAQVQALQRRTRLQWKQLEQHSGQSRLAWQP